VEPHRHEGVFVARGKEDALVTLNSTPGVAVYGEKRISVEGPPGPDGNTTKVEYRVWNPFRSKRKFVVIYCIYCIYCVKCGCCCSISSNGFNGLLFLLIVVSNIHHYLHSTIAHIQHTHIQHTLFNKHYSGGGSLGWRR
jgi:hypothetical protein